METLQKTSLFWDVIDINPQKHAQFIIERILAYGDEADFNWAIDFYGKEKVKDYFLKSKTLDKKSLSFWCQYFNLNKEKCIQKQSTQKQSAFSKK
jgi:hypothetical protein